MKSFDPKVYQNKRIVYSKVPRCTGISYIWEWDGSNGYYRKREFGNRYYAYKRVHVGIRIRQVSRCFESLDEARAWKSDSSQIGSKSPSGLTFKTTIDRYFAHITSRVRETTLESYRKLLPHLNFFKDFYVEQIDSRLIDQWLTVIKSPAYVEVQHKTRVSYEHEVGLLSRILRFYGEYENESYTVPLKKRHNEDCVVNLVRLQERKTKNQQRYIRRVDIESFTSALRDRSEQVPTRRAFFVLANLQLMTGMRIGEACALEWRDVDFEAKKIIVQKTVHWKRSRGSTPRIFNMPKGGNFRTVPIVEPLLSLLLEWQLQCGRREGLVFSRDGFTILTYREIQHQYDTAFEKVGLPFRSTHILRHTFATDFLTQTKDQYALQTMLGHSDPKQVQTYAKVTQGHVNGSMKLYEQSLEPVGQNVIRLPTCWETLGAKSDQSKTEAEVIESKSVLETT